MKTENNAKLITVPQIKLLNPFVDILQFILFHTWNNSETVTDLKRNNSNKVTIEPSVIGKKIF